MKRLPSKERQHWCDFGMDRVVFHGCSPQLFHVEQLWSIDQFELAQADLCDPNYYLWFTDA
jgi:hypothetical protein